MAKWQCEDILAWMSLNANEIKMAKRVVSLRKISLR